MTGKEEKEMGLLEEITAEETMALARQRVKRNKGSAGIDGMTVQELDKYFMENGTVILQSVMEGKYRPRPVRGVEIPKDNGKKRQLGIPTAVDRTIQQAITMKLTPIFEPLFSDTSYGFRPGRSAHDVMPVVVAQDVAALCPVTADIIGARIAGFIHGVVDFVEFHNMIIAARRQRHVGAMAQQIVRHAIAATVDADSRRVGARPA